MGLFKKKYLIHIIVWVTFQSIGIASNYFRLQNYEVDLLDTFLTVFPNIVIFYLSFYLTFKFLNKQKWPFFLAAEVLLFIFYLGLFYIIGEYISPLLNPSAEIPPLMLTSFIIDGLWSFLVYSFYSFGYYFAETSIKKERQLRISEEARFSLEQQQQLQKQENLLLQQEKLQLENDFLRSQINPHTLHNILNMLYSKSIKADAPDLADAIMLLSNLMRYSLESATDSNGRVPLEKELEQINNTIKMNQLRSSNKFHIDFKVTGDPGSARVIPLILITLVENAFKYAELNEPAYPLQLHITVVDTSFVFYMHNKKKTVVIHETSHGIGIENTRQRLKAAYGNDGYDIRITQNDQYYTFHLTIHDLNKQVETIHTAVKNELATT
jgi:two-component system, LytTR family, sensor kinase